jgi:hypothetical protein
VTTGGGEINIQNIKGNFNATTGGGSVHAANLGGSVVAVTGGGDMELTAIQGSVHATTGGGGISAEITLTDFTKNHEVTLTTGGGDIRLTVPEKLPATISAKIKMHRRNWEEFTISSDFPLQVKTEDVESGTRLITAKGDINGGGDMINLETGGGNIRILKPKK